MRLARNIAALAAAATIGRAAAQEHAHHAAPATQGTLTLADAVAEALSRNPDLVSARERAAAAEARARAAGRFPVPEIAAQLWQQPLDKPFDFSQANMLMIGLRQPLPAPGSLSLREQAGREGALARASDAAARRLDLVAAVRKAFAEYAHAAREEEIHRHHLVLNEQIVALARLRFESSSLSKRDVLRTQYELARLHADLASVARSARSTAALLNTLMARPPDAPLGAPEQRAPDLSAPDVATLDARADDTPAVASAGREVASADASLGAARREASWPGLMVGLDYGYGPMDSKQTYTFMLGIPLPWLSGARRDAIVESERSLAASRASLEAARNDARYVLREAAARVDAAREAIAILDGDLVPQAERSAEQAQSDLRTGQGDAMNVLEALHTLLSVRLERSRAVLALEQARADLDRAAGVPWTEKTPGATP